jgi:hypothetical protein
MKADFPSIESFDHAAWMLRCKRAAIQAFAKVESGPEGAFLASSGQVEPTILFERHKFHGETGGRYANVRVPGVSESWAIISSPVPSYRDKSYGPMSKQHLRLQTAVAHNRDAALRSASWGLFQIMGFNHKLCGYDTLQAFVTAMYRDVDDHLRAFVMFILKNDRLVAALRAQDWATAALLYNGEDYKVNRYDEKMAQNFAHFSATA